MTKFTSTIINESTDLVYRMTNLTVPENIPFVLQQGVYAIRLKLEDEKYNGVLYYGPNATLGDAQISLSVNILDTVNLIIRPGEEVEIEVVKYIREIKEFNLPDELMLEMQKDEERARVILMK